MLLYKFRSTNRIEHLLDIILNERLYCAEYSALNDPFEGQFRGIVPDWNAIYRPNTRIQTRPMNIGDLPVHQSDVRVCSLSRDSSDVRLWSLYADGHKGVALEIDFEGLEEFVTAVNYTTPLPKFGTTLLGGTTAKEVLSHKTDHWAFEKEYRIISENTYFPIQGKIRRVICGIRTPVEISDLLTKLRPIEIPCTLATLDHDGVTVQT